MERLLFNMIWTDFDKWRIQKILRREFLGYAHYDIIASEILNTMNDSIDFYIETKIKELSKKAEDTGIEGVLR